MLEEAVVLAWVRYVPFPKASESLVLGGVHNVLAMAEVYYSMYDVLLGEG